MVSVGVSVVVEVSSVVVSVGVSVVVEVSSVVVSKVTSVVVVSTGVPSLTILILSSVKEYVPDRI